MVLNVLIACEESQAAASAFRALGHNAFSCDLVPCSGGHPEYHIMCDCSVLLYGDCNFITEDGSYHHIDKWDLIIAHPPCTYLTAAGATSLYSRSGNIDSVRFNRGLAARHFFMSFYDTCADYVAIENPRPLKIFNLPACSQVINPYDFGEPFSKRTYLWLINLPPLIHGASAPNYKSWTSIHSSARLRSKSFQNIAAAMAEQWSNFIVYDKSFKSLNNNFKI